MCGIAGIYAYHRASREVDRDELRRIRDHMIARGPDGVGEWYAPDHRVGLGHRRLSIIDLSERAAQPMQSADKTFLITFNGEIYNYKELRRELESKGRVFRSNSDTEVLLHLYAEKGATMVHDLRGMFAFALWDAEKRAMLLARDPYGIKPLYYTDDGRTLRFASQVKALLAGGGVSKDPEPAGLAGFYLLGSIPEPFTTYQAIRALPAGAFLYVDESGLREPTRYFSIAQIFRQAKVSPHTPAEADLKPYVREALLDSLGHHLVADVPVGAFLSAGVDSGALVGLMRDVGQEDIQTVTLAFEEFRGGREDEAPLAERIASQYRTRHTTRLVTEQEFHADLPHIQAAMDQPSIDGINTWFVSKAARELGLKVAISGLGGDELFGGYPSFRDVPRWVRLCSAPAAIPWLGQTFRRIGSLLLAPWSSISPKALGLIEFGGSYPGAYLLRRGLFMPWELPSLLGDDLAREGLHRLGLLARIGQALSPDPGTPFSRVATLEASFYLRNQLLRDADWAGMAHSLEIRVPLVDAKLLADLAPALIAYPGHSSKELLGLSPETPLPRSLMLREKTGFQTPIETWLVGLQCEDDHQARRCPSASRTHWSRRWATRVIHS